MDRRTRNTFVHEIIGLFIISRLTVSALWPPKCMFHLQSLSPQFVIQLWATTALWWALMRSPSFLAHHWNTQTNGRGYWVVMKQIYVAHFKWRHRDDRQFTADELGLWFTQLMRNLCIFQYVPENLLPVYREKIVPLSDILTPNQFEAEWVQPPVWVQTSGIRNLCAVMVEKRASR